MQYVLIVERNAKFPSNLMAQDQSIAESALVRGDLEEKIMVEDHLGHEDQIQDIN